ncbi:MAG: DNRLRE domain-containing protein [Phycisphaerae bacterium]
MVRAITAICLMIAALGLAPRAGGATLSLTASADATLYQSATGGTADGGGEHLFAGITAQASNRLRRTLVKFNLSAIPPGSVVQQASLTMYCNKSATPQVDLNLHRVLSDWTEGSTNDTGEEGDGATSVNGDVTWIHRTKPSPLWTTTGGDWSPTISATTTVYTEGFSYTWGTTPQMVADVQNWVNTPGQNFGWLVRSDDLAGGAASAKRFSSRTNLVFGNPPRLTICYVPPSQLDLNCDTVVDAADRIAFATALVDPVRYAATYSGCDITRADLNCDGLRDGRDVQTYVTLAP